MARLRSCACGPASIWLDALPTCHDLRMSTLEFAFSLRYRLDIPPARAPANADGCNCDCDQHILPHDLDHAMNCTNVRGPVI